MQEYERFRSRPGHFTDSDHIINIGIQIAELATYKSDLSTTSVSDTTRETTRRLEAQVVHFYNYYVLKESRKLTKLRVQSDLDGKIAKTAILAKAQKDFTARMIMALFGGFALVVPMLIMSLHPSRLTNLLTTSLFVFAVAAALAWFMKTAEPKDIIGATAAYAAVLVVFVGTSTTSGP